MLNLNRTIYAVVCLLAWTGAAAQGLKFSGMDSRIDQRTSLDVSGGRYMHFADRMDISFEFSDLKERDFGYMLRIRPETPGGPIWNISYDAQGNAVTIRLNEEGRYSLIRADIPHEELRELHWTNVSLCIDAVKDSVTLAIGPREYKAALSPMPRSGNYRITFGRSDHIIDVPTFAIRNLVIGDVRTHHVFRFTETDGKTVESEDGQVKGSVENPGWLAKESVTWEKLWTASSESVAGVTYYQDKNEFLYFNKEGLTVFSILNGPGEFMRYKEPCPLDLRSGMCCIDGGRLIAYEPQTGDSGCSVAALDLETLEWTPLGSSSVDMRLYHHTAFKDPETGRFTLFGGFGNSLYNKRFIELDENWEWKTKWRDFEGLGTLYPRYFTSSGVDDESSAIYIFGGMGNDSGEQVVGRRYFYDLHRIIPSEGRCEKLWKLKDIEENIVPVRNLIPVGGSLYTLCYPEYLSQSRLHLYRFDLATGAFDRPGDDIGIVSDKLCTNANLYWNKDIRKMFATTLVFEDDIRSELTIWSISFPPATEDMLRSRSGKGPMLILSGLLLLAAAVAAYLIARKRRQSAVVPGQGKEPGKKIFTASVEPNSIYTFGPLQIIDRFGRDIGPSLSAQQRTIFILLLEHLEDGIGSSKLSALMWPDKEEEKVKNSRGVAILNLRARLKDVEGLSLVFSDKSYRLVLSDGARCDVADILGTIGSESPDRRKLLSDIGRGKFLAHEQDPLFDKFKEKVESRVLDFLEKEMENSLDAREYRETVEIAGMVFSMDSLSEKALFASVHSLMRLKDKEEALTLYSRFAKNWREAMGESYGVPFKKIP